MTKKDIVLHLCKVKHFLYEHCKVILVQHCTANNGEQNWACYQWDSKQHVVSPHNLCAEIIFLEKLFIGFLVQESPRSSGYAHRDILDVFLKVYSDKQNIWDLPQAW